MLPELTERSTVLNLHCLTGAWRLDSPPPGVLGGDAPGAVHILRSLTRVNQPSSAAMAQFPALDCNKAVGP